MKITAILFDKDGTLLDFHKTWMPVYGAVARLFAGDDVAVAERLLVAAGLDAARGVIKSGSLLAAGNNEEIADCFAEALGKPLEPRLVAELDRIFAQEAAASTVAVPAMAQTLGRLKDQGYRLGVATSDSAEGAEATLAPFGVIDLLEFVAGYNSGHGSKPGPGMVLGFCTHLACTPAEVAVVGDNSHDMDMARAASAGLRIGVLTGTSLREDLAGHADHVIDSIADLESLLESRNAPL
jgi:phosphoglycolate phosphatase